MAIFQLEIADVDVTRVFNAVCGNYGRVLQIDNPDYIVNLDEEGEEILPVDENGVAIPLFIDNPESQGDFVHRKVREFLSDHVRSYEMEVAKQAAMAAAGDASVNLSDPDAT